MRCLPFDLDSKIAAPAALRQVFTMPGIMKAPALFPALLLGWFCLAAGLTVDVQAAKAKDRVATSQFRPAHGFFEQPFTVEVTTKTPGAQIYYTTNGVEPTERTGARYTGPIKITTTTVLRAAAFKPGQEPSVPATQTYLFLKDVVKQTGAGFPATWGTNLGQNVRADYEMDSEVVNNAAYRAELGPALLSLPSLSVAMAPSDLFEAASGLYAHPKESGVEWERPASVELILPGGGPGFQINCGIRIQGGWNRRPEESPKHSFRLLFKKKYGPGKLKFPLFEDAGVREFDTLILRGGCNNTWLHWSGEERRRGDFIRDQWMRDTYRALGHPSARGRFVHLYLNGLYWGLYNPSERPSGPFVAAHLGGQPEDYDVRNGANLLEGDDGAWQRLMTLANAGVTGEQEYAALQKLVDMPALADFLLVNLYGANSDWDRASNWYAARRRQPSGPYYFFVWDGERTLEGLDANSLAFDDDQSPTRLFQKLRVNPEFQKLFQERARLHLTNGGALTPEKTTERYRKWTQAIESAVVAESARWGDYRRDAHPYKTGPYELYTRDAHWRPEIERLLKDYFPKRTEVLMKQLRAAGLFPKE